VRSRSRAAVVPEVVVLIPAGGLGTRLGRGTPKQFLRLGRMPILTVTVGHFTAYPAVKAVVIAAPAAHVERCRRLLARLARKRPVIVVPGGATRQESVWRAFQHAPAAEIVVVHDGVRPFIDRRLLEAVVGAAVETGAAICALPITETVKRAREGLVQATLDRADLWAVQTPQAFQATLLREAHDKALRDGVVGTDDAMLVERLGHPVRVVPGLPANIKITTAADLHRARAWARP
jgi:2-C-methyl-D-erythritol 4-phosphate cytidylyltransferase